MEGRSLAKYVIFGIVGLLLLWIAIRFTDLILGWTLYSWFFQKIREVGALPDLITGAIAVWCVAAILLLGPTVLFSYFVRGRKKAVVIYATAISFGMVSLYLLSLCQSDNLFNPFTGSPNYVFVKEPDSAIKLFPHGYLVDPLTGKETQLLTPEVAQAYREQQARIHQPPPPSPPLSPPVAVTGSQPQPQFQPPLPSPKLWQGQPITGELLQKLFDTDKVAWAKAFEIYWGHPYEYYYPPAPASAPAPAPNSDKELERAYKRKLLEERDP